MDTVPATSSIPHAGTGQQSPASGTRSPAPLVAGIALSAAKILGSGLAVGAVVSAVLAFMPYDRVVIPSQAPSITVRASSVKLSRGGFVALYAQEGGLKEVGNSQYLSPGYHRDVVIYIETDPVINNTTREYVARIYHDDGDEFLDETRDRPLLNRWGSVYQKKLWFLWPRHRFRQWFTIFLEQPFVTAVDALVP